MLGLIFLRVKSNFEPANHFKKSYQVGFKVIIETKRFKLGTVL